MTDDLIARLRRGVPFRQTAVLPDTAVGTAFAEPDLHSVVQTMVEAADRLAHLEAEVARLTKERDEAYERNAALALKADEWEAKYGIVSGLHTQLAAQNGELMLALHDAICSPKGVVSDSSAPYYSSELADEAEARRKQP